MTHLHRTGCEELLASDFDSGGVGKVCAVSAVDRLVGRERISRGLVQTLALTAGLRSPISKLLNVFFHIYSLTSMFKLDDTVVGI